MRANGDGPHGFALNEEGRPKIARDVERVDGTAILSGKPVNLVGSQTWIKRVGLENRERPPRCLLLDF